MKLKFRRGKPPLKFFERFELKRIATLKMKKAAKLIEPAQVPVGKPGQFLTLNGWRDPTEEEKKQMEAEAEKRRIQAAIDIELLFCPLCKKALSLDNVHEVTLNGQKRQIHSICPEGT